MLYKEVVYQNKNKHLCDKNVTHLEYMEYIKMPQISARTIKYLCVTLGLTFTTLIYAQQPFQTYDMIVSDPAGVVAALDKYQASQTGQQGSATVILSQYLANGESLATHQI